MNKMHKLSILMMLILLLVVAAMIVANNASRYILGGAIHRPDSPHIIVDALNLTHWLTPGVKISPEEVAKTITTTAAVIKRRHPGRVMYVVKDRDTILNTDEARKVYAAAATENGVYVYSVERYADPPQGNSTSTAHSAHGRDDFLMAVLAKQWRCNVLTEDRLRDFSEFRATLQPFHVYEYTYFRDTPSREFYRPESTGYATLRKPRTVRYAEYFK